MKFTTASNFTGARPWDALPIGEVEGASVRLHWSDAPYIWHINDGAEVFALLDGEVIMKTRTQTALGEVFESEKRMVPGDIFYAAPGDEHVAHPVGVARMLVVEKKGSI